jgi:hypothetical protein
MWALSHTLAGRSGLHVLFRRVRAIIFAVEMQTVLTYSECVFLALVIQHAKRMLHIFICGLYSILPPYLIRDTISENSRPTQNAFFLHNFVENIFNFKNNSGRYNKCTRKSSRKVPAILVRF